MIARGWDGPYELRTKSNEIVQLPHSWQEGDVSLEIYGGSAPHKDGSSGRVWVRSTRSGEPTIETEWFPHVVDMVWTRV